jgi:hypothetical protein
MQTSPKTPILIYGKEHTQNLPRGQADVKRILTAQTLAKWETKKGNLHPEDPRNTIDLVKPTEKYKEKSLGFITNLSKLTIKGFSDGTEDTNHVEQFEENLKLGFEEEDKNPTPLGKYGRLAALNEDIAMKFHAENPDHPNVKKLLTVGAIAHDRSVQSFVTKGFENGSVIEAAKAQKRNPLIVVRDLYQAMHLPLEDPRLAVRLKDIVPDRRIASLLARGQKQHRRDDRILDNTQAFNVAKRSEAAALEESEKKGLRRVDSTHITRTQVGAFSLEIDRQRDEEEQKKQAYADSMSYKAKEKIEPEKDTRAFPKQNAENFVLKEPENSQPAKTEPKARKSVYPKSSGPIVLMEPNQPEQEPLTAPKIKKRKKEDIR